MRLGLLSILIMAVLPGIALDAGGEPAGEMHFSAKVAPLFEKHCLHCHGGDTPKGGLSLVKSAAARAGGDSGPAFVPGKPEESLLLKMIAGAKPKMPQQSKPLAAEEVATVRQWIAAGAVWPDNVVLKDRRFEGGSWWAFQPLQRPQVPTVRHVDWVRTPIDTFILQQLEAKGLTPGAEADRRTLIRRLTFNLHGLPPTPEQVEAFLHDASPNAYEKLVDALLDSPRYGERWARHWLDVAHYGDTHGYDKDKRRSHAWPYRDYVIRSFNADKPYSRFVQEQLAGDRLFPGEPDGVIATGFIAAGPWDFVGHVELREGTVDKAKTRLLDRDDMLASTMSTFASLTVHCARCHDHKFDPIPQRDYYRLQAVFAGVERGDRAYADLAIETRKGDLTQQREALEREQKVLLDTARQRAEQPVAELEKDISTLQAELAKLPATPQGASPSNGYHSAIMPAPDAVKWVQVDLGMSQPLDTVVLYPARPTDFRDAPGFGFPLRFRVEASDEARFTQSTTLANHTGEDFVNPGDTPVIILADRKVGRYVRITAHKLWKRSEDYVFALAELHVLAGSNNLAGGKPVTALDSIEAGRWSTRFLVDEHTSRSKLTADSTAATAQRERLTRKLEGKRTQREALIDQALTPAERRKLHAVKHQLVEVEKTLKTLPTPPQIYAAVPRPPRPIHLLPRGDVEKPEEQVWPGALAAVPGLNADFGLNSSTDEAAGRAALARWLTDPQNPLTWRSLVNRVWHYHFGKGIVDTPNDFGRMGGLPSHPELLDWLAVEFRDGGQSLKKLHKLIVMSAAYRQGSNGERGTRNGEPKTAVPRSEFPVPSFVDSDNRLLWRMNRQRLDAEALRDAVLAVSGQLDLRMGGPGFELFRFRDDHSPEYDHTAIEKIHDPATYRRTIYRFIVRSVPNPFLDCLDGADPNQNVPVRTTTLTALQALALLNDPFMLKQAELLAARLEKHSSDANAQLDLAYRLLFARLPTDSERSELAAFRQKHGLASLCRVLFNANEFVFVD